MKRIAIATLLLLALPALALAGATLDVANIDSTYTGKHLRIPVNVSGDTNTATIDITDHPALDGRLVFGVEVEPGADDAAPAAAFDVTLATPNWSLVWSAMSHTANSYKSFNEASGPTTNYPMITGDVTVTVGNLGAGNTAVVRFILW